MTAPADAAFAEWAASIRAQGWPPADADLIIALAAATTGHTDLLTSPDGAAARCCGPTGERPALARPQAPARATQLRAVR